MMETEPMSICDLKDHQWLLGWMQRTTSPHVLYAAGRKMTDILPDFDFVSKAYHDQRMISYIFYPKKDGFPLHEHEIVIRSLP